MVPRQERRQIDSDPGTWAGVDRELFEVLRECRLQVARARRVPPYIVLHDTTLRDLARRRPTTSDELLQCYGIGVRKANDLGPLILEAVRSFCGEEGAIDLDDDPSLDS